MKKLLLTGAGGSPATNFVRSLRMSPESFKLIGVDCNKYYIQRAETDFKGLVPKANENNYIDVINDYIEEFGVELIYASPDIELPVLSVNRDNLKAKVFMPRHETILTCLNKFESFKKWEDAGIKVPGTMIINDENDLKEAFCKWDRVWVRDTVGAAGKGSLPTDDYESAKTWIDFKKGWGVYTAADCLTPKSVTWQSIWKNGVLVVAQSRERMYWEFADRAPSGITGITGTGLTMADSVVDDIAQKAIFAIDDRPNGIFSVDLTYDKEGIPNPTEINIGRFFTTHLFFSEAGLNMPYIFTKLAFDEESDLDIPVKINPLPVGKAWIRGMDFKPILTDINAIESVSKGFGERLRRLNDKR